MSQGVSTIFSYSASDALHCLLHNVRLWEVQQRQTVVEDFKKKLAVIEPDIKVGIMHLIAINKPTDKIYQFTQHKIKEKVCGKRKLSDQSEPIEAAKKFAASITERILEETGGGGSREVSAENPNVNKISSESEVAAKKAKTAETYGSKGETVSTTSGNERERGTKTANNAQISEVAPTVTTTSGDKSKPVLQTANSAEVPAKTTAQSEKASSVSCITFSKL